MLEQLKYINHLNEVFDFGKDGIFVDSNDLHDYTWNVTKKNNRISGFDYGIGTRKLPVTIICDTESKGIEARNKLFEVVEKDVLAKEHGKIVLGDYYFRCFVTKSQKKDYLLTGRHMKATLTLTTDFPYWIKESTFMFPAAAKNRSGNTFLDYSFDYPVDFTAGVTANDMANEGFVGSNFRMVFYGPCSNPTVYIGGHKYQVNCDVGTAEYLTVDSVKKKIILTQNDGTEISKFSDRNRDDYIFEKIPSGNNDVSWDGAFGFDVTLLEERSEPKWT